ncbi:putative RNA-directed DNA polymerase from transposon BS [Hypsizygus marmoreus]|uniref:RNA-directed DNA polymerase from transposon BS n=1 Tax=Hypsizygus marmoreus TaxID=39966 RepID=A0A369JZM4_HYPMA|nr:putative RNA-directed DNA polymerase from transposon BS [Hypsizygus marmoreus]
MEQRKTPSLRAGGPRPLPLPDNPTDTLLNMYIDDGTLRVSSKSLDTNVRLLRSAFIFVVNWLISVGLSTAAAKTELMHHSWRQDKGYSPNIRLPTGGNTEVSVAAGDTIRILGVFLDRRLTFNQHVRILADRAGTAVKGSRMLANTVKGLSQVQLRTLYQACIVPVLTYASPIWWTGKKTHANMLEKVQNSALRHIAGAFRTTPIKALEIDLAIPPISLALDLANARYADRLHKLNTTNPVIQRLPDEWRAGSPATTPPPLPSQKPTRSKKRRKLTQLETIAAQTYRPAEGERIVSFIAPPWRKTAQDFGARLTVRGAPPDIKKKEAAEAHNEMIQDLLTDHSRLLLYSDGSMLDDENGIKKNVGWGVVGYHRNREVITRRGGMGHTAEVYDAELTGLVWAAREATKFAHHHPEIKHIHIYADNTAAVTSVFEPKTAPGQYNMRTFNKITTDYLARDAGNTVHVQWCPGHTDVKGNERADEEAKEGALLWQPRFVTLTHAMRRSKARVLEKWTDVWRRTPPTGGFGIANRFPPAWKPKDHVTSTPREVFGRLTQCRTRHAFIGEYYAKFVPTESVECPCGVDYQTRQHIITECPRYGAHRHILTKDFPEPDLPELLGTKKGLEALAKFLAKSGAFTKTGAPRGAPVRPLLEDEEDNSDGENWWERMERSGGRSEAGDSEEGGEEGSGSEDEAGEGS